MHLLSQEGVVLQMLVCEMVSQFRHRFMGQRNLERQCASFFHSGCIAKCCFVSICFGQNCHSRRDWLAGLSPLVFAD